MKKYLALALAAISLGCNAKSDAEKNLPRLSLERLGWYPVLVVTADIDYYDARYFDVLIYRHKETGKCAGFTPSIRGGTLAELSCELYGILSPEAALAAKKAKKEREHKEALAKAKEEYERLLKEE